MCSKCPPPAHTHDLKLSRHWSIAASITFCSKFASSIFAGHRCHTSLFRTRIVALHRKFYNLQVHFDEAYTIRLMQFSLVISHWNTFLLCPLSRGSVATLIRRGGCSSYRHMYRSSLILTVKTALKSVNFSRSYIQKYVGSVFTAHGVVWNAESRGYREHVSGCTCRCPHMKGHFWWCLSDLKAL